MPTSRGTSVVTRTPDSSISRPISRASSSARDRLPKAVRRSPSRMGHGVPAAWAVSLTIGARSATHHRNSSVTEASRSTKGLDVCSSLTLPVSQMPHRGVKNF